MPECRLIEYYGSSEHSLVSVRDGEAQNTVGKPVPEVDLSIRDNDGNELSAGEEGEVWVRSPLMFAGYLTENGLDTSSFDSSGWLSNGDRGILSPQGTLEVRARAGQSVITSGGHQVSTAEVETVLRELPEIREVVVLGTKHDRLGMVITAVIEPHPGTSLKLNDLRAQVAQYLAPAKRPRLWWSSDALPRTASGKVVRVVDTVMESLLERIR
jgi:long-chain acyl-CoA synthetase